MQNAIQGPSLSDSGIAHLHGELGPKASCPRNGRGHLPSPWGQDSTYEDSGLQDLSLIKMHFGLLVIFYSQRTGISNKQCDTF